jgi:hypothetical protein
LLDGRAYDPLERTVGMLMAPDAESWAALHRQLVAS